MPDEPKGQRFRLLGRTGLNRSGGLVYEEQLRQLSGSRGAKVYAEMRDNDAMIGSILFLIEMLVRQVKWTVKPASEAKEDQAAAQFVEECRTDMSHTWEDLLAEVLSMLWAGWSYFELVYKRRMGPGKDPTKRSRFRDGKIGWRKIELRSQESLDQWDFDEDGGIKGMYQRPAPTFEQFYIPIEKALLFRTKSVKNSPEGRSLLRNAFKSWYYKKKLEEIEAIGAERDLVGLPKLQVPVEMLLDDAPPALVTLRHDMEQMGEEVRRDERAFIMVPAEEMTMSDGQVLKTGYKFELLKSAGQRQIDTDVVIRRYRSDIAMTVLAQFLLLGQDKVGSFSLASEATNTFAIAIGAILQSIASVFNRYAIPRLFEINAWEMEALPELVPGDLEKPHLEAIATFLEKTIKVGAIRPGPALERKLRQMADLPEMEEDEPDEEEVPPKQQPPKAKEPKGPAVTEDADE